VLGIFESVGEEVFPIVYEVLNTLYITLDGAHLRYSNGNVLIEHEESPLRQVPLHHLGALMLFGNITVSPPLIEECAHAGRAIVWYNPYGEFRARLYGPTTGNVLLRCAQHDAQRCPKTSCRLAMAFVTDKIQNQIFLLQRALRTNAGHGTQLQQAQRLLSSCLEQLPHQADLDAVRGTEGIASHIYFNVFDAFILAQREAFRFTGRTRRPPRDRINALLSFIYTLVAQDCISALEGVGLDPQVGYLNGLRAGRPALALDLMEELRPAFADRFALRSINRRQVQPTHFIEQPDGAVYLNEEGRKQVLRLYQERKGQTIQHPDAQSPVPWGLIPHLQARRLAQTLRGERTEYEPYLVR